MNVPFSVGQFLDVFQRYNEAIWPAQIVAYALGLLAVIMAFRKTNYSSRIICLILSLFWFWMGIVYHIIFFSAINKAAFLFGGLFIIQGALFLFVGAYKSRITFRFGFDVFTFTGLALILYAMAIYPLLGYAFGHGYPRSPCYGVAPCPATIFTFGILLWTDKKVPKYVLIIPFLWSLIGFNAALFLSVTEDVLLPVAAVGVTALIIIRDRSRSKRAPA